MAFRRTPPDFETFPRPIESTFQRPFKTGPHVTFIAKTLHRRKTFKTQIFHFIKFEVRLSNCSRGIGKLEVHPIDSPFIRSLCERTKLLSLLLDKRDYPEIPLNDATAINGISAMARIQ